MNQANPASATPPAAPAQNPKFWYGIRKIFLVWAILLLIGFGATHFYPAPRVNILWTILALFGLGYMKSQLPFAQRAYRHIFLTWLIIIVLGLIISASSFYYPPLYFLLAYLGIFWLLLLGIGHLSTGLITKRKKFYKTALAHGIAAILIAMVPAFFGVQYLAAGVVASLSMVWLIVAKS